MKIQKPGRAVGVASTLVGALGCGVKLGMRGEIDLPAEDQSQGKKQLGDIAGRLCRLDTSNNHVGESGSEH